MWISEIAERAIMQAMGAMDVSFRASRVDNEPASPTERKEYPSVVIMAASGSKDTTEDLFFEIPVTVSIITHYEDDPKRATLKGLEDTFMKVLELPIASSTIRTAYNSIASTAGESRYLKGLTNIDSSPIEITDKTQTITITMTLHSCGS